MTFKTIIISFLIVFGMTANSFAQSDVADQKLLQFADMHGDGDPDVRDKIAYEGLVELLRGDQVSNDGKRKLLEKCETQLLGPEGEGFIRPFAALCIAEVARTDRVDPWFRNSERRDIVNLGVEYLKSVTDYRGFDEGQGWRHGVAHGADVLMQLTLNDKLSKDNHKDILTAIASQISPNGHFYIYGEPARLARPALFVAMRGTITEDEWAAWFDEITSPGPQIVDWANAFSSQAGLSKRHNVRAFLSAMHLNASMSENEQLKSLIPILKDAMAKLP